MIIDCISDLHGHYPKLEGGDLLIVAGDLTARGTYKEYLEFFKWLQSQQYRKKVFIYGNHDNLAVSQFDWGDLETDYLCDSGIEFEYLEDDPIEISAATIDVIIRTKKKFKIYGSPWIKSFPGMNATCKAFTLDTEEELAKRWALIPNDTEILITHSPPYGMLDRVEDYASGEIRYVGSKSLSDKLMELKKLKLHVFGHVHEGYGECYQGYLGKTWDDPNPKPIGHLSINASHVNEHYRPVNKPVRIEL
jgi:Icc-related predicted phosphoesterase